MKLTFNVQKIAIVSIGFFLTYCTPASNNDNASKADSTAVPNYGGYASREQWGEHLVTVCACNDCHTPKKMTPEGPVIDSSLLLSGHPADLPIPDIERKEMEKKGYIVTQTLTAWIG